MMWCPLVSFLFTLVLAAHSTKDLYDENHQGGNHSFTQPRQASYSVNFDSRSIEDVIIQTPRFSKPYPAKSQINWIFQGSCDMYLFCPIFKLRPRTKNGICRDYLEIQDGDTIVSYCGNELNGRGYISKSTQMDLIFKSNSKRNKRYIGFNCTITCLNTECNCGVYTPPIVNNDKIVGGTAARDNQFPWQALMVFSGTNDRWCGGSLINCKYVLTAAHCTDGYDANDFQILLGAECLSNPPPGQLRVDILNIIQNDGYNPSTFDNDIALLELATAIDFVHTQFRPVCLPINNTDPIKDEDNVEAAISGFGALEFGGSYPGSYPDCLQYAVVDTMTNELCNTFYSGGITDNMICAGFPGVGEIDSCQGDSGGPMSTNATSASLVNYYVQIGVVSFGNGCADPDYPGVYTRVSEYITWINNNTADSKTCLPP